MLIGASLLIGFTWAYNFDDQNRVLQRTRDMKDVTPMTSDEGKRLRSLIEGGRLKIVDPRRSSLKKELEDAKHSVTRRLKKHHDDQHQERSARIPRGGTITTRAEGGANKKEKKTKATAKEATRSKPVETTRHNGHDESSTPKDTGRKKTKTTKTSRHDP